MYFSQANEVAEEMRSVGFTHVYVRHITRYYHPDTWVEAWDRMGELIVVKRYEDWVERERPALGLPPRRQSDNS